MTYEQWKDKHNMKTLEEGGFWTKQELRDYYSAQAKHDGGLDRKPPDSPGKLKPNYGTPDFGNPGAEVRDSEYPDYGTTHGLPNAFPPGGGPDGGHTYGAWPGTLGGDSDFDLNTYIPPDEGRAVGVGIPGVTPHNWDPTGADDAVGNTNIYGATTGAGMHDPNPEYPDSPIANNIQDLMDVITMVRDPRNSPQIGVQVNPGGVDAGLFNFPIGKPTNVQVLDADGRPVFNPNNNPLIGNNDGGLAGNIISGGIGVLDGILNTEQPEVFAPQPDFDEVVGVTDADLDEVITGQPADTATATTFEPESDFDEVFGVIDGLDDDSAIGGIFDDLDPNAPIYGPSENLDDDIADIDGNGTTDTPPDDTGGLNNGGGNGGSAGDGGTDDTGTTGDTDMADDDKKNTDPNWLDKLLGFSTNTLSNTLSNMGNSAINYYGNEKAADAFKEQSDLGREQTKAMYDADVLRLDPYNQQLGIDNLTAVNAEASTNPEARNMFAGQADITGTTDVQGPTAGRVNVNQNSPYDVNDPGLKYLMDVGTKAITDQQVGKGKYHSGGTLERLQELGQGAALNRGQQIQGIESMRDQGALAADSQRYQQDVGSSMFGLDQARGNIASQMGLNEQLFNQNYNANQFDQSADLNAYNQLSGLVGIGQNSAAQQGANTAAIANQLGQMSQNQGYADFWKRQQQGNNLSNLFGQMFGSGK